MFPDKVNPVAMNNDKDLVFEITKIMREADLQFEKVGGSTKHYIRDCFLPLLEEAGYKIIKK